MSRRRKVTGKRGSWFARIENDPALPCVHQHWARRMEYDDPFADPSDPVWREFIGVIETNLRVILTSDKATPSETANAPPSFQRTGYIAAFDVSDVRVEGSHLRFRFVRRIDELE